MYIKNISQITRILLKKFDCKRHNTDMTLIVVCKKTDVNLYVKKQVFICTYSNFRVTSQRPAIWRKHNWWRSWWTECCQLPAGFSGQFARNKAPEIKRP
jgi:hypothetical protein